MSEFWKGKRLSQTQIDSSKSNAEFHTTWFCFLVHRTAFLQFTDAKTEIDKKSENKKTIDGLLSKKKNFVSFHISYFSEDGRKKKDLADLSSEKLEEYQKAVFKYSAEVTLVRNRIDRNATRLIQQFLREHWFAAKAEIKPSQRYVQNLVRNFFNL